MKSIYTTFKCKRCRKHNITLTEEVEKARKNRLYLSCMYCNSKNLSNKKETNDLRECFKNQEKRK